MKNNIKFYIKHILNQDTKMASKMTIPQNIFPNLSPILIYSTFIRRLFRLFYRNKKHVRMNEIQKIH